MKISKQFNFLPILKIGTITIRGTSTMRIERFANNTGPTAVRLRLAVRSLHMSRLRDERGSILALAAVMIPVFLLLAAMVIDVGNWYTHKRQLQNRADAAAFAAGVEYAKNWQNCVYAGTDPTKLAAKAAAAQKIADAARQYAGDPEASDYAGAAVPATGLKTPRSRRSRTST